MGKSNKKQSPLERVASEDAGDKGSMSSFEKLSLHSDSDSAGQGSPTASDAAASAGAAAIHQPPSEITIDDTAVENLYPNPSSSHQQINPDDKTSPSGRSMDPVVRELEEAAAVAAAVTREAAAAASQRIMRGAAEAKAFMSSMWSVFDDPTQSGSKQQQEQSDEELRQRLGLGDGEAILETFRCKLIQAYRPSTNTFTPAKTIGFSGQLHITAASVCFELDSSAGAGPPVVIPKGEILSFTKEGDAIEIQLKGGRSVALGQFSLPRLEVESAVALLEMLTSTDEK